jgi:hypothetical protein
VALARFLTLLIAGVLLAAPAWSQASTGSVRGTVRDQTGGVVPRVSVTLTRTATNVTSKTTTNEVGFYLFPGVAPGQYRLAVEAPGMQKYEGALTVQVQQDALVDPVLQVGQTATEVVVQDVTPLVTADNPSVGHVLERQRIEQLPINGRGGIGTLLNTVPGIEGSQIRAYGLRMGSHLLVFDGSQHNEKWEGWNQQRPPGLDAIEEFRVETNNSSAKYSSPVTIVMSSRSGTNQLHGAVFETNRNNAIGKARARQDYYTKAPYLNRNEFGASAGGPVFIPKVYDGRNRTFWFFAWEAARNIYPSTKGWRVPTPAMRNGDFSGLKDSQGRLYRLYDPNTTDATTWQRQPFSYGGQLNVIDPARQSPLAKYLYSITPLPTEPNVNPLVDNNWWGLSPAWYRGYTVSSRIDQRFTDQDQFYARYTHSMFDELYQSSSQIMLNEVPGAIHRRAPNKAIATSWVHTFSPTLFNSLMVGVSRDVQWRGNGDGVTKWADQLGLPNPFSFPGWPQITGTGISGYSFNADATFSIPFTYGILEDNATKIKGRHEIQFGYHYRYDQLTTGGGTQYKQGLHDFSTQATALYDPTTPRNSPLATALTGSDAGNMFLGVMNYGAWFGRPRWYFRSHEYAGYLQDNLKVSRRLTLNLGVRWDLRPPIRDKHDVIVGFDLQKHALVLGVDMDTMYKLGAALPAVVNQLQAQGAKFITYKDAGIPRTMVYTDWKNFGPRLGLAYRLQEGVRPFVVRGGYRISYFPIPIASWADDSGRTAPLQAQYSTSLNSAAQAPDGIANYGLRSAPKVIAGVNSREAISINNLGALSRGFAIATFQDPHQPDGMIQDWNLTLEKEIMSSTVLKAAYIGNHGGNLENQVRINDATPAYIWYATRRERLPSGEYANVATRPYDQQVYGSIQQYSKTGWSNFNGMQFELERRFDKGYGYQVFYVVGNTLVAGGNGWNSPILGLNQFLPGAVPTDLNQRNRLLNYQRDTAIPKHRVRWNWIVDVPVGKGKFLVRNASGVLNRVIGGWQMAGMGSVGSTFFALPTSVYPNGNKIEIYGYKYPIEDCRSGACSPGYLWWNGYIPANQINSVGANGKPNGVMGVPADYKPAGEPLIPWPEVPDSRDPMYAYFGTNTVWIPLKDGTQQRIVFNDNLHPWRQQYFPSVRQWGLDASLFKNIPINERLWLRFNADFFNVLNHPGNPSSVGGDGILNVRTSGTGARQTQLTLRLVW